jgi:acetyl-CoA carboxylase biotin carboxyl carrier protein
VKLGARRPPLAPDAEVIRALAGLLAETGLTEIEYAIGDHRIRVAREADRAPPAPGGYAADPLAHSANGHAGNGHAANGQAPPQPATERASSANGAAPAGIVNSPMVGVAYLSAQPGASPFVQVGDRVSEGQTLLIIEAMKVMNQIRSTRAGQVTRILVEDAAPVEYGAPLLVIE